ncbi:MAG: hypothetical protein ACMG57_01995 [Candidatus Dojkabacteria bacterium]
MPEFLKNKRNLFIIAVILFILLTCCIIVGFLLYRAAQNSNANTTTEIVKQLPPLPIPGDDNPAPAPTPAPTPVSKTPITLKYPTQFTKATYVDEGCGHQAGITTYTYTLDPTIRVGQLVVSNKNLPMDAEQVQDFQDAVDVVDGTKTVVYSTTPTATQLSGLPLRATYAECGGAAYYPAETFSVNYPGVDKAIAIMSIGGTQSYFDDMTQVDMTLFIYAKKGDEIAEISLRFKAGDIFTAAEGNACMTTQDGNTFIDPQCVVDNAHGNATKINFYKAKAVELMNVFALAE